MQPLVEWDQGRYSWTVPGKASDYIVNRRP